MKIKNQCALHWLKNKKGRGGDNVFEEVYIFCVLSVVIASVISVGENETTQCTSTSTREDEESGHSGLEGSLQKLPTAHSSWEDLTDV